MAPPDESGPDEDQGSESDSARKSKTIVRIVAGGFLLVGVLNLLAYLLKARQAGTGISLLRCLWLSIPLVVGLLILIKTSARIEEWLDQ
jgi:hypothetical protein